MTRLVTLPPFKKNMKRIFIFASIFYTLLLLSNGDNDYSPSTTPASDCYAIVYDVLDCIPYLSAGSEQTKVDALCCSSFETVLEISRECICVALKGSRELGLTLNIARAIALPSACGSSVLPFNDCDSKWDLSCFAFLHLLICFLIWGLMDCLGFIFACSSRVSHDTPRYVLFVFHVILLLLFQN